jgi:hypothetical protein
MIMAFVIMNTLVVYGLFFAKDTRQIPAVQVAQNVALPIPTVELKLEPSTITAGSFSGISWTTTGEPTSCKATGNWAGDKTMYGAESTGRVSKSGNYIYTLTCTNASGTAEAKGTLTVGNAVAPAQAVVTKTTASGGSGATYCGGRIPCYGPREIATHSGQGNCWGWNAGRVINITGFDTGYHKAKSGISNISVSGVCGTDLGPSLAGQVAAGGQTRDHLNSSKTNTNANEYPYFVGYYDAGKP